MGMGKVAQGPVRARSGLARAVMLRLSFCACREDRRGLAGDQLKIPPVAILAARAA